MSTVTTPLVEWSAEARAPREASRSAYAHTVRTVPHGVLIAVVEGVGAAADAAMRARAAIAIVERSACAPLPVIVHACHEELKGTGGVVMSLALFDARRPVLWWLGVGHLPGYIMDSRRGSSYRALPLRTGIVGQELPAVTATSRRLGRNDTLIIVTDSVHWDPGRAPGRTESPALVAQRLVEDYCSPGEAGIAVAARYLGLQEPHA